jgi:uncharacterized protein (DUF305 family)
MRKHFALLAALITLALGAACSNGTGSAEHSSSAEHGSSAEAKPAADHNGADATFAKNMIPHHGQAIAMAKLAPTRASSPQVKSLAQKIEGAQDPEIRTMSEWLRAWREDVPSADMGNMAGHGSMQGMMSAEEMAGLDKASGADFDRMFLDMMIRHHQGAIEMAKTEQQGGKSADAKALAAQIEKAQSAEIDQMKGMLGRS